MKNELLKEIENLLENNQLPLSLIKDKIKYRRIHITKLAIKGHKQKEIALKLGCSISTVEKDFHFLREKGGD